MPSFNVVNYSVRPSKAIQRNIIFNALRRLGSAIDLDDAVYIGFGSIWFTDFLLAHKVLDVDTMVSIEKDDIGYRRACFNKVYRSIDVRHGTAFDEFQKIVAHENALMMRPWIVWLDYDSALNEDVIADMRWLIEHAPQNSVVLFSFSAAQNAYGKKPVQRPSIIRELLGGVVPDELKREDCEKDTIGKTLASLAGDFLKSEAADIARTYFDAFRIVYEDSVQMVTVGGVLPSRGNGAAVREEVFAKSWECRVDEIIQAPLMTLKETVTLQAQLPCVDEITREKVQELGFDLEDAQIRCFQKYYKYIPSFAEVNF